MIVNFTRTVACVVAICLLSAASCTSLESKNLVVVVQSQAEPYHASLAARLKADISQQSYDLDETFPTVHLVHESLNVPGAWTIVPLLRPLIDLHSTSEDVQWVFFCDQHIAVNYKNLLDTLGSHDYKKEMWVGYPLRDLEPTIIHHFSYSTGPESFPYPNLASGFAMSWNLVKKLHRQIVTGERTQDDDFTIDPAYELAQLVYGSRSSIGPLITPDDKFCVIASPGCATYPRQLYTCGQRVTEKSILFAVKTWHQNHETRAQVVKKTWGAHVTNLLFFSDKEDKDLPAINLGVPNTEVGHCEKTIAILKYIRNELKMKPHIKWVFLADDDTILSVWRLGEVLSCLSGGNAKTVIGERYGYGYGKRGSSEPGYDYITGGGGTALSVGAVSALCECVCPGPAAPDDMCLGFCAAHRHNITLTHSPLFHQARPEDYAPEYLARDRPVSFHKHWMVDPVSVYNQWFRSDDSHIARQHPEHTEL